MPEDTPEVTAMKALYVDFSKTDTPYAVDYILEIDAFSTSHTNFMLQNYGPSILQFESAFALLSVILEKLNYHEKQSWPPHRGPQYIFLVHNMKSLFAAFDLLNKGFSESSLVLLRVAYEAMINIIYISCYKATPYKFLKGEVKFTSFIKEELKLVHWSDYANLSAFSHANKLEVYQEIIRVGNKNPITISYKHNQENTVLAINCMHHVLYFFARFIDVYLFTTPNNNLPIKYSISLKKYIKLEEMARVSHPMAYWNSMTRDFDYIFKVMEQSEKNEDWKKYIKLEQKNTKKKLLSVLLQISNL